VPPRRRRPPDYRLLARVRRSLRALNSAISRGAEWAGLTIQQQAFLLAVVAYGGRAVPLADIREELEMDQATASALLRRLVQERLVTRVRARDRRAADISLTPTGARIFRQSLEGIQHELQRAEHRGELNALRADLETYLRTYLHGDARD